MFPVIKTPGQRALNRFDSLIFIALLFSFSLVPAQAGNEDPFFLTVLDYAEIADASYKDISGIRQTLSSQGYEMSDYQNLPGFSVSWFIATNKARKEQIIAVRGTSNVENTIVDASFVLVEDKKTGIDLHQGFALSARDIYEKIKPELVQDYRISTTGHSLGGAVAVILAMYLDVDGYQLDKVITFGQPKVTNISGSKQFSHLPLVRVVMPKDIVPMVPPADPLDMMKLSIFWHMGKEILLLEDKKYAVLSGTKSMMRAVEFFTTMPAEEHVTNHFMNTYLKQIRSKLYQPEKVDYEIDIGFSDWFGGK